MAIRILLLSAILLAAMAAPVAQAQLGLGGLLGLIRINGTVFCSINSATSTTNTPVFPNALVQLQCGNSLVSSTTTNNAGLFTILLDPITTLLSSLLNNCKLVVNTPLSTCNASLPAIGGLLQSPLALVGSVIQGLLSIINLAPTGFVLTQ